MDVAIERGIKSVVLSLVVRMMHVLPFGDWRPLIWKRCSHRLSSRNGGVFLK